MQIAYENKHYYFVKKSTYILMFFTALHRKMNITIVLKQSTNIL